MIVVRTPFRISFTGGGSDLPSYYRSGHGAVVSATIDKYMYIAIHPYFQDKIRIKYSRTEDVDRIEDIQHPIVRECLSWRHIPLGMELASFADVPAGSGLGSSSSFAVGLLHALHAHRHESVSPEELARSACQVEITRLREPIGKQDQYAAAYGGLNYLRFNSDETVRVEPVALDAGGRGEFERRLLLFYIGQEHKAGAILSEQSRNMADDDKFRLVTRMVEIAERFRAALERQRFGECGLLLDENWQLKRRLASGVSNERVESTYRQALESGATGGKLLGAGGGGFLLLYCEPERQPRLRARLAELREMPIHFSEGGSTVLYSDATDADAPARAALETV
ncbi:MAG: galactokinase [Terracidiphilus sp.]|jgi:D-glycero-alpha-D-manno-heptose-7-phosphate kinase